MFYVILNTCKKLLNCLLHSALHSSSKFPLLRVIPEVIHTQVHEELSRLPLESVPRYLTLGCFLIQEGADPCARNNLGQTPAQTCPSDTRDILLNYVNKSKLDYTRGNLVTSAKHWYDGPRRQIARNGRAIYFWKLVAWGLLSQYFC